MFDPDPAGTHRARIEKVQFWFAEHGLGVSDDALRAAFRSAAWAKAEARAALRDFGVAHAVDHVLQALGLNLPGPEQTELITVVEDVDAHRSYEVAEGAAAALSYLHSCGVRLGIVSNLRYRPSRIIRQDLVQAGLIEYFEPHAIAISDQVGFRKPRREIFLASLRALDASPDQAAHIGDSKAYDVQGARQLGIMTVRYAGIVDDRGKEPEADVVIRDYEVLAGALGLEP